MRYVATFRTMKDARRAIAALERGGVRASSITLAGEKLEATRLAGTGRRDERVLRFGTRTMGAGVALGTAAGGVAGAAVGALLYGWLSVGMWACVIVGVVIVGLLGFFWATIGVTPQSEAGMAALESDDPAGDVTVEVRTTDDGEIAAAEKALDSASPERVDRRE
ncbi:MAG: hypothetical protein M3N17_03745 [Actinomycetota bacterium]|nr:hypothetical protein [Actinomycetota bacterium]